MVQVTSSSPFHGVGRRKSSVARVFLKSGKGDFLVNGKKFETYFDTDVTRERVQTPLKVTTLDKKFDIFVNVDGGGMVSQSDAVCLGLARALLAMDKNLKPILKKHKLLHCDSRVKERKKYGQRGARRKFQFVKR